MMYRRELGLAAGSATVAVLAIAACAVPGATTTTAVPPADSIQEYSALVAAGAKSVTDSLLNTPGLAPATAAQITKDEAEVQTANSAIQQATEVTSNASTLGQAVRDLGPVLLTLLPGGTAAWMAVNAFMALTPTIMALAGVPAPAMAARTVKVSMSVTESVLVLRGFNK